MPAPTDENSDPNDNVTPEACVPAEPKSFSPDRRDPAAPNAWDSLRTLTEVPPTSKLPAADLRSLALGRISARQLRYRFLPRPMFGEPAWDMLLSLYVTSPSDARQTVSNLSSYSEAPPTTALRWIDFLEGQEYVTRRPSNCDLRVVFVELTAKGRDAIEAYLVALREQRRADAPQR